MPSVGAALAKAEDEGTTIKSSQTQPQTAPHLSSASTMQSNDFPVHSTHTAMPPQMTLNRRNSVSGDSQSSASPHRHLQSNDGRGSSSSSSNKKTLADALASSQGVAPSRKRKRVHYSCAECHRRKHKCDRSMPCQPCLDRGLGDSCRPFQDGDEFGDERDRLKRLEDLVEGLARAHAALEIEVKAMKGGAAQVVGAKPVQPGEEEDRLVHADANGATRRHTKRARIIPASIDIEREELRKGEVSDDPGHTGIYGGASDEMVNVNDSLEGGLTREGDSFYGALALPSVSRGTIETQIHGERLELSANIPLRSASVKVHRLIQEGGAPPDIIEELMGCLPSRETSDAMLTWYFRDINDTRLPLHERTFRASYEEIMQWRWGNLRHEEGDDGARHIPFLSFLFVILAIAKRSEPEERCTDEEARKGALFFLHCARRSMAIASAVRADHIDVLLAALFGARLLITLRQSAESWSLLGVAIRAAQAIGLHRDGTKLGLDAVTTERRRRLWALIYYLDRTTSMLLGRPQAIDDKTSDCLPPCDVDIDVLPRMGPAPEPEPFPPTSPPSEEKLQRPPGVYQFIAIRHELAKLVGRVVEHFQDLSRPRNYADVLQIDKDLQRFYAALTPPYLCQALRGKEADRSFDGICPWLPIHRYLLNLEYHYVRITLHRPYLLRSFRYRQSREAAFDSAKADRLIRREFKKEVRWSPDRARNSHLGGVYRLFASTLIAGIELLLDPNSNNAPELHEMLDDFLANSGKVADPSQCTKRELAIIRIFKAKALDPNWCAATATGAKKAKRVQQKEVDAAQRSHRDSQAGPMPALSLSNAPTSESQDLHPSTGGISNEMAQTLLDRLGGLETLGVLNQHQSPSSAIDADSSILAEIAGLGNGGNDNGAASTDIGTQSYEMPQLNGLFDPSLSLNDTGTDWTSFANDGSLSADQLWNVDYGQDQRTTDDATTSGAGNNHFAGWGTLVEAIVSGQEGGEEGSLP